MRYAFAHRGGRAHGADNVLSTFSEALARGATGLETDAWVTADGVVVLDHDGLHRVGAPDQVSITAVRRSDLAAHVPTLADLYDHCGSDFDLAIDVKGDGAAAAILEVAQLHGAAERLWLFTPGTSRPGEVAPAHGGVTVRASELRLPTREVLLSSLREEGIEAVNARWQFWHRSAVAAAHQHGLQAFAWDVQGRLALWRCKQLGIDGVFSDHVRLLHAALR